MTLAAYFFTLAAIFGMFVILSWVASLLGASESQNG